jgi:hypothetical protein
VFTILTTFFTTVLTTVLTTVFTTVSTSVLTTVFTTFSTTVLTTVLTTFSTTCFWNQCENCDLTVLFGTGFQANQYSYDGVTLE